MIWYSAGTVVVTNGSPTVTGSGTAWVANVQPGDAIHLPDGRAYEVSAVTSDTSLTISPGYLGSTASGQDYRVQPTRGVVATLVASVQTLISQVQGYVDGALAGRFGNGSAGAPSVSFASDTGTGIWRIAANVLGFATGGVERMRLTAAGLQLTGLLTGTAITSSATDTTAGRVPVMRNSGIFGWGATESPPEITTEALNDLPTGLYRATDMSLINGGDSPLTGGFGWVLVLRSSASVALQIISRNNGADGGIWWRIDTGAWQNLYDNGNLLGTVSQESGVPTGAAFERGSNANGQFVRIADGTQVCQRQIDVDVTNSSAQLFSFPAAFSGDRSDISIGFGHLTSSVDDSLRLSNLISVGHTETGWFVRCNGMGDSANNGTNAARLCVQAKGRWF